MVSKKNYMEPCSLSASFQIKTGNFIFILMSVRPLIKHLLFYSISDILRNIYLHIIAEERFVIMHESRKKLVFCEIYLNYFNFFRNENLLRDNLDKLVV